MELFHIQWQINYFCNYNCPYCNIPIKDKKNYNMQKINLKNTLKFFNRIPESFIVISGGESFLHPDFIKICEELEKKHYIFIITNMSSDLIPDFVNKMNPKKVSFRASLHLTELNKFNSKDIFLKNIKLIKEKGFKIDSSVVMWPPIFKKFDSIYTEFEKLGIYLIPMSFYGTFKNKIYPNNYSKNQLVIIKKYWDHTNKMTNRETESNIGDITDKRISFKGSPCYAGIKHIMIDAEGNIKRCFSDNVIIGNINDNQFDIEKIPKICNNECCICLWEGYNYSIGKPKKLEDTNIKAKNNKNNFTISKIIKEVLN